MTKYVAVYDVPPVGFFLLAISSVAVSTAIIGCSNREVATVQADNGGVAVPAPAPPAPAPAPPAPAPAPPAPPFRRELFTAAHRIAVSYDVNAPTTPKALNTEIKLLETAVKTEGEKNTLSVLKLVYDNQDAMAFLDTIWRASDEISRIYQENLNKKFEEIARNALMDPPRPTAISVEDLLRATEWQLEIRAQLLLGKVCFYAPHHPKGSFDFRAQIKKKGFPVVNGQYGSYVAYEPAKKALLSANEALTQSLGLYINNDGFANSSGEATQK